MFDLQQKTSDNMLKTPNVDFTCHEEGPSNNEIQVSSPEGSGNSHFPSKISQGEKHIITSFSWVSAHVVTSKLDGIKNPLDA